MRKNADTENSNMGSSMKVITFCIGLAVPICLGLTFLFTTFPSNSAVDDKIEAKLEPYIRTQKNLSHNVIQFMEVQCGMAFNEKKESLKYKLCMSRIERNE